MESKILVIATATNAYVRLVPYYIYSLLHYNKSYNIDFLVLVSKGDNKEIDKLRNILPNINIRVEELDDSMNEIINDQKYILFYRFLIPTEYYENYDYVHIGDIDIIICEDIFARRLEYLKHNSYCNKLRKLYNRYNGNYRLHGLHTFKVKEYIENYKNNIDSMTKEKIKEMKLIDEQILYNIVRTNEKEVEYVKKNPPYFNLIGGFHVGDLKQQKNCYVIDKLIPTNYLESIRALTKDETFIKIHSVYNHKYINNTFNFIKGYYGNS